jgi:hypothetical protein
MTHTSPRKREKRKGSSNQNLIYISFSFSCFYDIWLFLFFNGISICLIWKLKSNKEMSLMISDISREILPFSICINLNKFHASKRNKEQKWIQEFCRSEGAIIGKNHFLQLVQCGLTHILSISATKNRKIFLQECVSFVGLISFPLQTWYLSLCV